MFSLEGRAALVTGGGRGIGKAIAAALAQQGAKVAVIYNGSKERAEAAVGEIEQLGGEAICVKCNVADPAECENAVNAVMEKFGRIDILVNNAGITRDNLLLRMKDEEFDEVIAANLKGTFTMTRLVSKIMLKQKYGRIINLSSVSGVYGNAGQANYAASKAGVIGMTKSVAKELAGRNITCNALAPGYIETDMTSAMPEKAKEAILASVPAKRTGKSEEVAAAAVFFASEEASYVTGQVLEISGGM